MYILQKLVFEKTSSKFFALDFYEKKKINKLHFGVKHGAFYSNFHAEFNSAVHFLYKPMYRNCKSHSFPTYPALKNISLNFAQHI